MRLYGHLLPPLIATDAGMTSVQRLQTHCKLAICSRFCYSLDLNVKNIVIERACDLLTHCLSYSFVSSYYVQYTISVYSTDYYSLYSTVLIY